MPTLALSAGVGLAGGVSVPHGGAERSPGAWVPALSFPSLSNVAESPRTIRLDFHLCAGTRVLLHRVPPVWGPWAVALGRPQDLAEPGVMKLIF